MRMFAGLIFVFILSFVSQAAEGGNVDLQGWTPIDRRATAVKLAEARAKLPALAGLDDERFIGAVHRLYYRDRDIAELYRNLGYAPTARQALPTIGPALLFWSILLGAGSGYATMRRRERARQRAANAADTAPMNGVLKLLAFHLGAGPLLAAGAFYHDVQSAHRLWLGDVSPLVSYFQYGLAVLALASVVGIVAALCLRFVTRPASRSFATAVLCLHAASALAVHILLPQQWLGTTGSATALAMQLIACVGWGIYLMSSQFVREHYANGKLALAAPMA